MIVKASFGGPSSASKLSFLKLNRLRNDRPPVTDGRGAMMEVTEDCLVNGRSSVVTEIDDQNNLVHVIRTDAMPFCKQNRYLNHRFAYDDVSAVQFLKGGS